MTDSETVWVLGDQLNRQVGPLAGRSPDECRVLLVESDAKIVSKPWHRQRLHLILSAMRHFAAELKAEGFEVDERRSATMAAGLSEHREAFEVSRVVAMEPANQAGRALLEQLGVELTPNEHFTCHPSDFEAWAADRGSFKMEDFYRWQRQRLGVLIDGDEPVGDKWNFDHDNREKPPTDGRSWPTIATFDLDDIDRSVLEHASFDPDPGTGSPDTVCPDTNASESGSTAGSTTRNSRVEANSDDRAAPVLWGAAPSGVWPVTREQALTRLDEFIESGLHTFGPHQDAMLGAEWKLSHSVLSSSLNLGLLTPAEVVDAAEAAFRDGDAQLSSVEGFIRQIIGWREYVHCVYWHWLPDYRDKNALDAHRAVPPAFTGGDTHMACVSNVIEHLDQHAYGHHIERLMVLGNLALTAGVDPWEMTEWMWASFIDGAEWVMLPNVIGMALHADGGLMATKPYASGGAYINRMGDHCKGCRYDPKQRVGDDACPFTTLYWDFLARNRETLQPNHRMARPLANLDRLSNIDEVRIRAADVLDALDAGEL